MAQYDIGRVTGLSAYEVWRAAGNTGSETEYLAAIKGPQGDVGERGPTGERGPQGEQGPAGGNITAAAELPTSDGSNVQAKLDDVDSQLAAAPVNICGFPFDVFTDDKLDGAKISAIFSANDKKTFIIPDGTYLLVNTINIDNEVSLILSGNAVVKAAAAMDDMLVYNKYDTQTKKRIIEGGVWDGDGKATNCIRLANVSGLIIRDMIIKNPVNTGLKIEAGYEIACTDMHFINTITTNIIDNVAMDINCADGYYSNIIVQYYTTGIVVRRDNNMFRTIHIYCGAQSSRTPFSKGIVDYSSGNKYTQIYFDTCFTGFTAQYPVSLFQCIFIFGAANRKLLENTPTFIDNQLAFGTILCDQCTFLFNNDEGETYRVNVSNGALRILFQNCHFYNSANFDNYNDTLPSVTYIKLNTYTGASLPSDFPEDLVTEFVLNEPVANATGIPGGIGGRVVTSRIGGIDLHHQILYQPRASAMWFRRAVSVSEWGKWMPYTVVSKTTSNRPANNYVGMPSFDTTLNKPIWVKTAGAIEVDTLTITQPATSSGNITISLNNSPVAVAVSGGDTIAQIDAKIRATSFGANWALSGVPGSGIIVFTRAATGAMGAPSYTDTGNTGVGGSFAVTTAGVTTVWVDATGATV